MASPTPRPILAAELSEDEEAAAVALFVAEVKDPEDVAETGAEVDAEVNVEVNVEVEDELDVDFWLILK
jgi:hypothetical protein